jgi:hypothetical protein
MALFIEILWQNRRTPPSPVLPIIPVVIPAKAGIQLSALGRLKNGSRPAPDDKFTYGATRQVELRITDDAGGARH